MSDDLDGLDDDDVVEHELVHLPINDFRKQELIKWLCTPIKARSPRSEQQLAQQIGVTLRTLRTWKNQDEFLRAWEIHYLRTIGSPERRQEIMDTLYMTATDNDDPKHVQAAKTYNDILNSLQPQRIEVTVSGKPSELTEEQLNELLAVKAAGELATRGNLRALPG